MEVEDYGNSRRNVDEIWERGYDQDLAHTYIRDWLDGAKEYDV